MAFFKLLGPDNQEKVKDERTGETGMRVDKRGNSTTEREEATNKGDLEQPGRAGALRTGSENAR